MLSSVRGGGQGALERGTWPAGGSRDDMTQRLSAFGLTVLLVMLSGCYEFQPDVPSGPSELPLATYASVTIEYRQPNGCSNASGNCVDRVVFFGSWMRPGEEILLEPSPGFLWVGRATDVPVNWPPHVAAHRVRIFDPHLVDTDSRGVTAARLKVGEQVLTVLENVGTPNESGQVFVDDNGFGHNPF